MAETNDERPLSDSALTEEEVPRAPESPTPGVDFPIVGIGASAGGLEALEAFFDAMPSDTWDGLRSRDSSGLRPRESAP